MDSLEMGLSVADSEADAEGLQRGTEITLNNLVTALAEFGVEIIDPH